MHFPYKNHSISILTLYPGITLLYALLYNLSQLLSGNASLHFVVYGYLCKNAALHLPNQNIIACVYFFVLSCAVIFLPFIAKKTLLNNLKTRQQIVGALVAYNCLVVVAYLLHDLCGLNTNKTLVANFQLYVLSIWCGLGKYTFPLVQIAVTVWLATKTGIAPQPKAFVRIVLLSAISIVVYSTLVELVIIPFYKIVN